MNTKWIMTGILITCLTAYVFGAGKSESADTGTETTEIVWSEWWDVEWGEDNVQWIIDSFEESHPNVNVETVFAPNNQMFERLTVMSQGQEPPDVMGMEGHWAVSFDNQGILANLDPLLERDAEFRAKFPDSALMKWQGDTKVIWLYMMAYSFFYNMEHLDGAGIEPPSDWDELKSALRELKSPEENRYGLAIQLSLRQTEHMVTRMFMVPLVQFGGRLLDDSGNAAFNSDAGVRVLEYWKELIDEELVYPNPLDTDPRDTYALLAEGAASMMLIGPWVQPVVEQQNPDIQFAATPPFSDVSSGGTATGSGLSLSAKTDNREIAWEFMKHLWSDEVAMDMTKELNLLWATKSVLEAPFIQENPILRYMPQQIADAETQSLPLLPEMNDLYRVLAENMQAYYLGNKSASIALDDAAAYWNRVIAEYR